MSRWTVFLRFSRLSRISSTCLYRQNIRRLGDVVVRKPTRKFAVPWNRRVWNLGLLLGLGMMGGVSLTAMKYFKSDRTSNCQSQAVKFEPLEDEEYSTLSISKMSVKQFGFTWRLYLATRFAYLCLLFSPAMGLYLMSYVLGSSTLAEMSWKYVLFALQKSGPAFVKLGQWASTRRDLFTDGFCQTLSNLHLRCTPHTWEETVAMLEESLGGDWQDVLFIMDRRPIGSGCVAQVYRGQLCSQQQSNGSETAPRGALGDGAVAPAVPVAIKVLHPNIVKKMEQDICLMKYVASWIDTLYPAVHWVALTECVDEFTVVMEQQLDLRREARNLKQFKRKMNNYSNLTFPTPIYPYVTSEVLVESFEAGDQISEYIGNPGGELQKCLAKTGVEILLDMLFVHNFVHGDLHPGNILVQDSSIDHPKLVLLDCGIATSLETLDLENLHCVFTAIVTGEGWKIADLFLNNKQTCATLDEYRRRVGELVEAASQDLNLKKIRVDTLFSELFNIMVEHRVRIDPNFTSVMMAIMVIEGLGRSLDPNLDILAYAKPCLMRRAKQSLREQVSLRLQQITN